MTALLDDTELRPLNAEAELQLLVVDAECTHVEADRLAALQAERAVRVIQFARRHPELYASADDDAAEFAERAALLDLAVRINSTEDHLRGVVFTAEQAMVHLPALWAQARDGFVSQYLVQRTVGALARVRATADAAAEELEAERAAFEAIDRAATEWSRTCAPPAFNRRLKALVDRLETTRPEVRHGRAMRDRRVVVNDVEDGMSWFSILMPTSDARAAFRRATSTAKHMQKDRREDRTRDQIRADLCSEWLRGIGTENAVKTKVVVTIPVQLLAAVRDGVPIDAAAAEAISNERAEIVGVGAIDPVTAAQMFLEASSFRRVVTDPVRKVVLDMDRRTYRPTKAQRDWLILKFGTCARDGCERLAVDADIDHREPWAEGGKTNMENLAPLCPRDHRHRHRTNVAFRSRADGTVQVITPTGFESEAPAPF